MDLSFMMDTSAIKQVNTRVLICVAKIQKAAFSRAYKAPCFNGEF